jgi:hypothetical protein
VEVLVIKDSAPYSVLLINCNGNKEKGIMTKVERLEDEKFKQNV